MSSRCLQDVFKTSCSRLVYSSWSYFFRTSSGRFQDAFKTSCKKCLKDIFKTYSRCFQDVINSSWRHLQDVLSRRLQDIFKTSSGHFDDGLNNKSSKYLQNVFQLYLQDVFKKYHQIKLFLLTRLWDVFNTFLGHTAKTVIYTRICLGHTSEKCMVSVQTLQEWQKGIKKTDKKVLVFHFISPFNGWSNINNGAFLRKCLTARSC